MRLKTIFNFYTLGTYYLMIDIAGNRKCDWLTLDGDEYIGKVAVITGGHRGIGAAITKDLLIAGMHIIIGCRKVEDGEKFVSSLRESGFTWGKVTVLQLDLASLDSVRAFVTQVNVETPSTNYLINNAGILENTFKLTKDGFESTWQVNYLSHFLLTHLLLPSLERAQGRAAIVGMSSILHNVPAEIELKEPTTGEAAFETVAYPRSKLAITMFTTFLDSKLKFVGSNVVALSAHPGVVATALFDNTIMNKYLPVTRRLLKTPEQGAKAAVYAALYGEGGEYIGNCEAQSPSSVVNNIEEQEKLFEYSKESLKINLFGGQF